MSTLPRVRWTFHATAVVRNYAEALAWLERFCGLRALEYSDAQDSLVARRGGVTWIGDAGIELMEPTLPEGAPAAFLARYGTGMYGVALQVENLAEAATHLQACGAEFVGDPGRGFIFTKPQHTASVHLEWADADFSAFDPHFGTKLPPFKCEPLIDVPRVAYFGALVRDPAAVAKRFEELWAPPVLFEEDSGDPAQAVLGFSLVDAALTLFRLPASEEEMRRLWGPLAFRPRVHLMALRVYDLEKTADVLRREGIRILRGEPAQGELITHPDDTAGILLAWTDRDLPRDPRGPLRDPS